MENKYFTPDIEDICIGYELEINWSRAYEVCWVPIKVLVQDEDFAYTNSISDIINALDDGMSEARVPYLTKEQIEAEGWEYVETDINSIFTFKKSNCILYCNFITKKIQLDFLVNNGGISTLFSGQCKDINTFRKLCKLLHI